MVPAEPAAGGGLSPARRGLSCVLTPTAPLAGCHSGRHRVRHLRDTVCTSATERHAALLSAHVFPDSCLLGPLPAPRGPGFELGQGLVRGMPGDSRGGSVQRPGGVRGQRPGAGCGRRDRSFQTRREDGRVGADGESGRCGDRVSGEVQPGLLLCP